MLFSIGKFTVKLNIDTLESVLIIYLLPHEGGRRVYDFNVSMSLLIVLMARSY